MSLLAHLLSYTLSLIAFETIVPFFMLRLCICEYHFLFEHERTLTCLTARSILTRAQTTETLTSSPADELKMLRLTRSNGAESARSNGPIWLSQTGTPFDLVKRTRLTRSNGDPKTSPV